MKLKNLIAGATAIAMIASLSVGSFAVGAWTTTKLKTKTEKTITAAVAAKSSTGASFALNLGTAINKTTWSSINLSAKLGTDSMSAKGSYASGKYSYSGTASTKVGTKTVKSAVKIAMVRNSSQKFTGTLGGRAATINCSYSVKSGNAVSGTYSGTWAASGSTPAYSTTAKLSITVSGTNKYTCKLTKTDGTLLASSIITYSKLTKTTTTKTYAVETRKVKVKGKYVTQYRYKNPTVKTSVGKTDPAELNNLVTFATLDLSNKLAKTKLVGKV